jgi:hypothetical protein
MAALREDGIFQHREGRGVGSKLEGGVRGRASARKNWRSRGQAVNNFNSGEPQSRRAAAPEQGGAVHTLYAQQRAVVGRAAGALARVVEGSGPS